jgi:hypothetical protein
MTWTQGQQASFKHPAGRVHGTVAKVEQNAVLLQLRMAEGMPPRALKFTLRGDGTYRQAGKGPKSPVLEPAT